MVRSTVIGLTLLCMIVHAGMTEDTASLKRARLLLVDDEPSNIRLLHQIFRGEYELTAATSGMQALEICARERPDLVLMDVMMPKMDGLETCKRLRLDAAFKDLPIIFVTGQTSAAEETAALDAGGMDFITKPVNPSVVKARVRTQLLLSDQRRQLQELAFIDGLTGVANRRQLEEHLEREWRVARRQRLPLGLILIDIDHFKAYNDTYGHQRGDEALRWVAQTMAQEMRRPADLLARYGGEEFCCVVPGADMANIEIAAELLRKSIENGALQHDASPTSRYITISLGASSIVPTEQSYDLLVRAADEALYGAKHKGRNCSVSAAVSSSPRPR